MEAVENAYQILLWVCTIFLSLSVFACLIRAILGPRLTDRIVSINVICTKVVILIAIMSCLFNKGSMLDIALIYSMIGFLAVVALSKCYLPPRQINLTNPNFEPEARRHISSNMEGV